MHELLKRYGGRIFYAPPNEGQGGAGNDDDSGGEGNDNGGGSDDGGDKGGAAGSDKGGDSRTAKAGGLFAKRSNASGGDDKGGGEGGEGGEPKAGADGRPANVAEKFWDPEKKAIKLDALTKAYTDLEKAHGDLKRSKTMGGEVPEDAADYFKEGVTLPDDVKNLTLTSDDPGLKAWADVCKTRGIGKDLARDLMVDMFKSMDKYAPTPIDPDAEMEALGKGGPALVDGLFVWTEGLERSGKLSADDIDVIEGMMMTAAGAKTLAKFRAMSGEVPIPIDPGTGLAGMSQEQWNDAMKAAIKAKDYTEQARLEKLGESINGTSPAFSSRQGGYNIGA